MFVPAILPENLREAVRELLGTGISDYEIATRVGISRATVNRWRTRGIPVPIKVPKFEPEEWSLTERIDYAYLLGLYLGDGYIGTHPRSHSLVIALDARYEALIRECVEAVATFAPREPAIHRPKGTNGLRVVSYASAWPRYFPQHGPGYKHSRKIQLVDWQQAIVSEYPRQLLRGLIHSDGSRCENRFTVNLKTGPKEYSYPRYFFTNYSADIRAIFTDTCDQLGILWSQSNWRNISISHRDSVASLDSFVGPKS